MSRLEEIKNKVAFDNYSKDWDETMIEIATSKGSRTIQTLKVERLMDEVAKKYATECVKVSLEKASENTEIRKIQGIYLPLYGVKKESITNPDNIVLI